VVAPLRIRPLAVVPAPPMMPALPEVSLTPDRLRARIDDIAAARSTRCLVDQLAVVGIHLPPLVQHAMPPVVTTIAYRAWAPVIARQRDLDARRLEWSFAARRLARLGELEAARVALRNADALGPGRNAARFDGVRIRLGLLPRGELGYAEVPDLVRAGRRREAELIVAEHGLDASTGPHELAELVRAYAALGYRDRLQRLIADVAGDEQIYLDVLEAWLDEALLCRVDVAAAVDAAIAFRKQTGDHDFVLLHVIGGAGPRGQGAAVASLAHLIREATDDRNLLELFDQALERGDDAEADLIGARLDRLGGRDAAWARMLRAARRGTVAAALAAIAAYHDRVGAPITDPDTRRRQDAIDQEARLQVSALLWGRVVADGFSAEDEAQLTAAWCAH
jgi:hypothetical protein